MNPMAIASCEITGRYLGNSIELAFGRMGAKIKRNMDEISVKMGSLTQKFALRGNFGPLNKGSSCWMLIAVFWLPGCTATAGLWNERSKRSSAVLAIYRVGRETSTWKCLSSVI